MLKTEKTTFYSNYFWKSIAVTESYLMSYVRVSTHRPYCYPISGDLIVISLCSSYIYAMHNAPACSCTASRNAIHHGTCGIRPQLLIRIHRLVHLSGLLQLPDVPQRHELSSRTDQYWIAPDNCAVIEDCQQQLQSHVIVLKTLYIRMCCKSPLLPFSQAMFHGTVNLCPPRHL
jgi:hypothetical protein